MITARTSSHIKDREGVKTAEVMAKMFTQRGFLRPSGGQFMMDISCKRNQEMLPYGRRHPGVVRPLVEVNCFTAYS